MMSTSENSLPLELNNNRCNHSFLKSKFRKMQKEVKNDDSMYRNLKNDKNAYILELEIENAELRLELGSRQLKTKFCVCLTSDDSETISPPCQTNILPIERRNDSKLVAKIKELETELHESRLLLNRQNIELNRVQASLTEKSLEVAKLKHELLFSPIDRLSLNSSFCDGKDYLSASSSEKGYHSMEDISTHINTSHKLISQLPEAKNDI